MDSPDPIRNAAWCLRCGAIIESTHRHHMAACACDPYTIAVDGGTGKRGYIRRVGDIYAKGYAWVDVSAFEGQPAPGPLIGHPDDVWLELKKYGLAAVLERMGDNERSYVDLGGLVRIEPTGDMLRVRREDGDEIVVEHFGRVDD